MAVVVILVILALAVSLAITFGYRLLRGYAERTAATQLERPEKVHRLQRAMLGAAFSALLVSWLLAGAAFGVVGVGAHRLVHNSGDHPVLAGEILGASVIAMAALLGLPLAARRAVRPVLLRVREVQAGRQPYRARRALAGGLWLLVIYGAFAVALLLLPKRGWGHILGVAAVWPVALLLAQLLLVPLLPYALGARPLPASVRQRLFALSQRMGVSVRDIRMVPTKAQKTANAVQVGVLPGRRYILIFDYLADAVSAEQLDAVVAHELGHARAHHVLAKLAALTATIFALDLGIGAWTAGPHGALGAAGGAIAVPVGFLLATIVGQGLLGVRLERSADELAARCVGAEPLAEALEVLARLNDTKRNTGRLWSLLTQHPGIEERISRLHRTAAERGTDAYPVEQAGHPAAPTPRSR